MHNKRWTREQDLAVLYIKLEYKGQLMPRHPAIGLLAKAMHRTEASIWMRKGNFDSLDRSVAGTGLNHPAKLTATIWGRVSRESRACICRGA